MALLLFTALVFSLSSAAVSAEDPPPVVTTLTFSKSPGTSGAYTGPVKLTFTPVLAAGASNPMIKYVIQDLADARVVASVAVWSSTSSITVSPTPGSTKHYRAEFRSFAMVPGQWETSRTVDFTVVTPKLKTTLGKPSVPTRAKTTTNVKVTGSVSPARTSGSTRVVTVKFYRYERKSGHLTWVYKKHTHARLTSTRAYAASTKLTAKGSWSVICDAAADAQHLKASSPRSRTIAVK